MKILFYLSLILLPVVSKANFVIYKTYEDYLAKKGEAFDEYEKCVSVFAKCTLYLKRDGKTYKKACSSFWGFTYNDQLFRVDKLSQPARVIINGKIVYYENGYANLCMIRDNTANAYFDIGYYCYVSKDLTSEIVPFPGSMVSDAYAKIKAFKADNPKYKTLFSCIEKNYKYENVRTCVESFEKAAK